MQNESEMAVRRRRRAGSITDVLVDEWRWKIASKQEGKREKEGRKEGKKGRRK
jgi:hypothetical protein